MTPADTPTWLPAAPLGVSWEGVSSGMSGAAVYRRTDGALYAKSAGPPVDEEVRGEAARAEWLAAVGLPGPQVVDLRTEPEFTVLVTTSVRGVPLSDLPGAATGPAIAVLAGALRDLHAVPVVDCPFDRSLSVTVAQARQAAERGTVDLADLDAERQGASAAMLLDDLLAGLSQAQRLEPADTVVCHGDACLPNVMVDADSLSLTGFVDLGRLGRADRYVDLALATRSIGSGLNPQFSAADAGRLLSSYGIDEPDPWRLEYYRLLDEFF